MGIRKNAKFLTAVEREDFVRACVLLKADIANPASPPSDQYSRWDEYVAIHAMIQAGIAPGGISVNFGHGGANAFSFLSWHRYFLYRFELALQAKVPGVMLPYWDWTDPHGNILVDSFLGPDGTVSSEVRSGYFAVDAPGTGSNPTPAPAWWPAGLVGWRLPAAFGTAAGALRRALSPASGLPSVTDLNQALAKTSYSQFQVALENGTGLSSGNQMHNDMHGWIGGPGGQMSFPSVSPFDPFFYLHHCNIDRLWAMWQADGHANDYPSSGGKPQHNRNDLMYPWVGGAAGYGTSKTYTPPIPMPDFSALGPKRNVDTLDYRGAFGYSYDSIAVIGIGLDRTGSMLGLTPDPMTTGTPDVTKWEAAKRGVSAFLQDCETVQQSGAIYTLAGVKTFRRLAVNDFQSVFAAPGYGLVKAGTGFSHATFDSAVGAMSPGGDTPLADALLDVNATLVTPPFGGLPAGEPRYLAMLTDGLLTSGSPMASIADASLAPTAVFSMGFGTGLDVDYVTLQSMVDKGRTLTTQQVFHGENAGTIDKFYSKALAAAIGFTSVFDPVVELFAGEFTHLAFSATSADDTLWMTVQGMDFDDANWNFHLIGPDGAAVYSDMSHGAAGHEHAMGYNHCCRRPHATVQRARARLTVVLQRDSADAECWVGDWKLMASYRSRGADGMAMFEIDSLLAPAAAGPLRGPRHARLLQAPKARLAQRQIVAPPAHAFDQLPPGTNRDDAGACNLSFNVYARTRLAFELTPEAQGVKAGDAFAVRIEPSILQGQVQVTRSFARMVSPLQPLDARLFIPKNTKPDALSRDKQRPVFDAALALARAERQDARLTAPLDRMLKAAQHDGGPLHLHVPAPTVAGAHHLAVYIEGEYLPQAETLSGGHEHDHHGATPTDTGSGAQRGERFYRLLNTMVPVLPNK